MTHETSAAAAEKAALERGEQIAKMVSITAWNRLSLEHQAELAAYLAEVVLEIVDEERDRWVFHLDAALRDEPDTSRSDVNLHWRARIREIIGPRIEAAVAAEREACAAVMDAIGEEKRACRIPPAHDWLENWAVCEMTTARYGAAKIRARGGA